MHKAGPVPLCDRGVMARAFQEYLAFALPDCTTANYFSTTDQEVCASRLPFSRRGRSKIEPSKFWFRKLTNMGTISQVFVCLRWKRPSAPTPVGTYVLAAWPKATWRVCSGLLFHSPKPKQRGAKPAIRAYQSKNAMSIELITSGGSAALHGGSWINATY